MRHFAREILNFLQNLLDYRLPVGAGHCGVVRVGPRLSGAKPGSEQCLPPRGKQPHERASFAGWRRSLCAAKRPARGSARPPFNGQSPLTPRAGHCGVVSVGPRLSGAKPGSEQYLPPRGKQPHERASFAGWRRSLCAAKRPAPTARQTPAARRGQDPSLQGTRERQFVGSGLDRSGCFAAASASL